MQSEISISEWKIEEEYLDRQNLYHLEVIDILHWAAHNPSSGTRSSGSAGYVMTWEYTTTCMTTKGNG